jgi:AraC-like DNA-binding protein
MELIPHGTVSFPFKYYYEDILLFENQIIDWHWHKEVEFMTVLEGTVLCSIGNMKISLKKGSGIFINSGVIHRFQSEDGGIIPNILFAPEFIATEKSLLYEKYVQPFIASSVSHIPFQNDVSWQKDVLTRLSEIYQYCHQPEDTWELNVHSSVCKVWSDLYKHKEDCITIEKAGTTILSQSRLRRMAGFIEDNYLMKLTLQDIAQSAGVSKSEALRCFKNGMQTSPIDYLNKYRLSQARNMLLYTNHSISEIAEKSGFDSTSYFDRLFKREYGFTPKEYRYLLQKV